MLPKGKTQHDDSEIKKLETLNSILMKELRESKGKITKLEDENAKLKAENLKLKNSQSSDHEIDSHIKIERIKNEPIDNYQNQALSVLLLL